MKTVDSFTGAAAIAHKWRTKTLGGRPWKLRWKPVCASTEIALAEWLKEKPLLESQQRAVISERQTFGIPRSDRARRENLVVEFDPAKHIAIFISHRWWGVVYGHQQWPHGLANPGHCPRLEQPRAYLGWHADEMPAQD